MNTSYFPHCRKGGLPLLSIMMVSSTYRCMIYSRRLVRLLALTGKPSTGQTMDEDVRRKSTLYYFGVGVGWGWGGGTAPPPGLTSHDLLGGRQTWMPRPTLTHVPHTLPSGTDSCGGVPLASHPPPIGCGRLLPNNGPRLTRHLYRIFHFGS